MTLPILCLFLAAAGPQFDITDARGKKPGGVSMEAGTPDAHGWMAVKVTGKPKTQPVLIWPWDGKTKPPDGPGPINAIVIERGDTKALANPKVVAAIVAAELLGNPIETGLDPAALKTAAEALQKSDDFLSKGIGLLHANKPAEAVEPLARALRERERVLTRIPSDIYPAAMLLGRALMAAAKTPANYDEAATAFLKAINQRNDKPARAARAEALIKAGKPEAAEELLKQQ